MEKREKDRDCMGRWQGLGGGRGEAKEWDGEGEGKGGEAKGTAINLGRGV